MSTSDPEFPAIRNNWTRVAMRRIRSFPDGPRRKLLDSIPYATNEAISHSLPDEWLPAEHAIAVCDAVLTQLGIAEAVEFWQAIVLDSYAGGLLEDLVIGMRDAKTSDLLGLAPSTWELSARNCGQIEVVPSSTGLRLEGRGFPAGLRDSRGIQAMFAGAVQAMLSFSKLDAELDFQANLPEGAIGFELRFGSRTPRLIP